jgi:hypothetical protein
MEVESDVVLPRPLLLALAECDATNMPSVMSPSPWRLRRFGDEIAAILERTSSNQGTLSPLTHAASRIDG